MSKVCCPRWGCGRPAAWSRAAVGRRPSAPRCTATRTAAPSGWRRRRRRRGRWRWSPPRRSRSRRRLPEPKIMVHGRLIKIKRIKPLIRVHIYTQTWIFVKDLSVGRVDSSTQAQNVDQEFIHERKFGSIYISNILFCSPWMDKKAPSVLISDLWLKFHFKFWFCSGKTDAIWEGRGFSHFLHSLFIELVSPTHFTFSFSLLIPDKK